MNRSLTVERAYYFCAACGQGWLPLDEALGLPRAAATPALFAVAVTCGSVAPPEEAAELLAAVAGITLSPKSLERYTKAAGHATDRAVERRGQACQADTTPEPAAPVEPSARPYNLQFDGSMLRMRNATFREVKVGCLFDARAVAQSRRAGAKCCTRTTRPISGPPAPLGGACMPRPRGRGHRGWRNAISQGDGAPWVWHLVQEHWPAALEVLDFYHLSEHLHACAQAVWGVGSRELAAGPVTWAPRS